MKRAARARWLLKLTCGHTEERPAVWRAGSVMAKWPPSNVRCKTCPKAPRIDRETGEPMEWSSTWPPKARVLRASLHVGRRLVVQLSFTPRAVLGARAVAATEMPQENRP